MEDARFSWLALERSTTIVVCRLAIFLTAAVSVYAQLPVPAAQQLQLAPVFDGSSLGDPLSCQVETPAAFLDFSFRYEVGYVVQCSLSQFAGRQTTLLNILRIRPDNGSAIFLGQSLVVPAVPPALKAKLDLRHLKADIEFSGVFAAGEGEYAVDLAVVDEHRRVYQKAWRAKVRARGKESQVPVVLRPGTVAAISLPVWEQASGQRQGLRLTVFLDAAPMYPRSSKLRAWDRAFLLGALSSLLRQLPLSSVRLVAFNLEQQREVYRNEDFRPTDMRALADALSRLELSSVSYKVLQRSAGWLDLLARLLRDETERKPPVEAVVFVGPRQRFDAKISSDTFGAEDTKGPAIFNFAYFPRPGEEFPDAIQRITSARNGTTFKLHSPADLAVALAKMQRKLQSAGR